MRLQRCFRITGGRRDVGEDGIEQRGEILRIGHVAVARSGATGAAGPGAGVEHRHVQHLLRRVFFQVGGEIRFEPESGLNELRAEWHNLSKRVIPL